PEVLAMGAASDHFISGLQGRWRKLRSRQAHRLDQAGSLSVNLGFRFSQEDNMAVPIASLTPKVAPVLTNMDPRLQRLVFRYRQGITKLATSSTSTDEVAVVARVTDHQQWESLSEV